MPDGKQRIIPGFGTWVMLLIVASSVYQLFASEKIHAQSLDWVRQSDMLTPRTKLAVAYANGMIYAIGGYYCGDGNPCYRQSAEEYSTISGVWSPIADMPVPREEHGAVGLNGKIYVVGGNYAYYNDPDAKEDWLSKCAPVCVYDPVSNTWSQKAPMPTPRTFVAAAELNGEIWVIGGYEDGGSSAKVEIYDPVKNKWRNGPSLLEARRAHAAATLDGKVYVSGGFIKGISSNKWAEAYTLYSSSGSGWTRLPDMPNRRWNHAMVGYQGKLYILGVKWPIVRTSGRSPTTLSNSIRRPTPTIHQ
jgi:N-acetylneuraminic acid mutarotase